MDRRAVFYTCGHVARPDRDGTWRMVSDPAQPIVKDPLAVPGRERVAELRTSVLGQSFEIRHGEVVLSSQASVLERLAERRLPEAEAEPASIALRGLVYHLKGIITSYARVQRELIPIVAATRAAGQKLEGILTPAVDDAHHEWTALSAHLQRLERDPPHPGIQPRRMAFDASIAGFPRFRLPLGDALRKEDPGWDLLLEARAQVAAALDELELRWRQRSAS